MRNGTPPLTGNPVKRMVVADAVEQDGMPVKTQAEWCRSGVIVLREKRLMNRIWLDTPPPPVPTRSVMRMVVPAREVSHDERRFQIHHREA
jgi:hypothetical protein